MRITILLLVLVAGCGARTGLEASGGAAGVCGDGIVQTGEACDPGGDAGGVCPSFFLTQAGVERRISPVARSRSAIAFYSYTSKSAHTGFELLETSRLFLYRDDERDALSLFTIHGIDIDSSGSAQPVSAVVQRFKGLPEGTFVDLEDDYDTEIHMESSTSALGDWQFEQNTDGAIFSGIPSAKAFRIEVEPDFQVGVAVWDYVDGDATLVSLDLRGVATVERRYEPCGCQADCTSP